jgi:rhodanese-related sulfurtransferase
MFSKPYRIVSPRQAAALANGGFVLLDVREPHEWQAGHTLRARHIPLGQLSRRAAAELPKSGAGVTMCRSGARSARAAAMLARDGRDVSNRSGGMRA